MAKPKPNRKPKIMAGIPAYNQENDVGEVIRKASEYVDEVIVADDGSVDNTARVAEAAGAIVLWWKYQSGDRNALATLLQYNREDVVNLKALRERPAY